MPRILDNIEDRLDDALVGSLSTAERLDAAVGYFNLRGWGRLADAVDRMTASAVDSATGDRIGAPRTRLLIGMTETPQEELRRLTRQAADSGMDNRLASQLHGHVLADLRRQLTVGLPTASDEQTLRKLRRQLAEGLVQAKLFLRHRLHAKLYLCHRQHADVPVTGYVGSSNLTFAGLLHQGELNIDVTERDAAAKLHRWFEDRWSDQYAIDVTDDLVQLLDESWAAEAPMEPYLVYLKIAYHLSREAREGLLEYGLPASMEERLLDFQAAAVKIAARILEHRGGVMIGDVVGLGKTMIATAVARLLQEEKGTETLIVCPRNLVTMWEGYVQEYRLHAKVVSLSMVHRDLAGLRRYRVVVIDESHNLRSRTRRDYRALHEYIERNDSKVVLLTATPYNKSFEDVRNQLALFVAPDADLGIRPDRAIAEMGEREFLRRCDYKPSTLGAFRLSEFREDWQRLMSLFLVRRTRRFIEENYARTDDKGRRFLAFSEAKRYFLPRRRAIPVPRELGADDSAAEMVSDETLDQIDALRLPRYALYRYLDETATAATTGAQAEVVADLRRAASGNLAGVTRTMLYKRLSSSGPAFLASLRRHVLRNRVCLHAIATGVEMPLGSVSAALWEDADDEEGGLLDETAPAEAAYERLCVSGTRALRWLNPGLFNGDLRTDLEYDIAVIEDLLARCGEWVPDRDGKLDQLVALIRADHAEDKVLVFTESADTAEYVTAVLADRGIADVETASGDSDDPTMLARRFSPNSNAELGGLPDGQRELRVLVSTDVLSEGQNLQDAHVIVNYDLPWAIVRIIQRAGRVDRIGQQAHEVLVYSLLPADSVDDVIDLRQRIRHRLADHAGVFGSDEEFFGDPDERSVIEGLYDEGAGRAIEDPVAGEVDAVSMAYEVWRAATENNEDLRRRVERLPNVVYATQQAGERRSEGVLTHVQTAAGFDAFAFATMQGAASSVTPHEALDLARCEPSTPAKEPLHEHHDLVGAAFAGPLKSPRLVTAGALTGVRKRLWERFSDPQRALEATLFLDPDDVERALDAVYRWPLLESAATALARAMRERTPEDQAMLLVSLNRDNRLSVAADERAEDDEPRVICSMGYRT